MKIELVVEIPMLEESLVGTGGPSRLVCEVQISSCGSSLVNNSGVLLEP